MLDVKTLKVLEFLNEHQDEAFSIYQMGKCGMTVNFETMQWLTDKNMVFRYEDEDAFRYEYEEPTRSMPVDVRHLQNNNTLWKWKSVLSMRKHGQMKAFGYQSSAWPLLSSP